MRTLWKGAWIFDQSAGRQVLQVNKSGGFWTEVIRLSFHFCKGIQDVSTTTMNPWTTPFIIIFFSKPQTAKVFLCLGHFNSPADMLVYLYRYTRSMIVLPTATTSIICMVESRVKLTAGLLLIQLAGPGLWLPDHPTLHHRLSSHQCTPAPQHLV